MVKVKDLRLSFADRGELEEVVHGISFEIADGEIVGIVGESGSGKTQTALAMAGLSPRHAKMEGVISIDGKNIASLTRESLRSAFTMVLQDTWLFRGTIYENIAYGRPGATREEVIAAAKAEFDAATAEGYSCPIPKDEFAKIVEMSVIICFTSIGVNSCISTLFFSKIESITPLASATGIIVF